MGDLQQGDTQSLACRQDYIRLVCVLDVDREVEVNRI